MKKLITGAIVAAALLFGFTSCTGPLHDNIYDNEVQPLTIVGLTRDAGNHCVAMTLDKPDGSEQSLKFKLSEDFELTAVDGKKYKIGGTGSWGNGSPNQFKIIPSANVKADGIPDWKVDYGWETDTGMLYIKPGADYHALLKRGDAGTTAAGPSNVAIDGAIANEEYTIKVKYNAASQSVSVKVEGNSSDPSAMIINLADNSKNFPATDKDGKEIATDKTVDTANGDTYAKVTMEKAGTTYTYQFISKENETLKFTLKNDLAGTFGGTLTDGSANLALNEATATVISVDVKKNYEYKLTVDAKDVTKATLKTETVSMLKNTAIYANWKYAENFYEEEAKDKDNEKTEVSYLFFAENTALEFVVNRVGGTDYPTWGAGTTSSVAVDGSELELKYFDGEKDDNGKLKEEKKNVKVTGLKVGTAYNIILTADNDNFTLKTKVEALKPVDVTGMYLMCWLNTDSDWSNQRFLPLKNDGNSKWTVDIETTSSESVDKVRFDLCKNDGSGGQDWSTRYGIQIMKDGIITIGEKAGPFISLEPSTRDYFEGTAGKSYHFEFDGSSGLFVTITEK